MALNFPLNPTVGDTSVQAGKLWYWDGIHWSTSGPAGFQGSAGHQGSVGFIGSLGGTGYTGSVNTGGYRGSEGYQGSAAFQGSSGFQGSTGYQSSQGFQGSLGIANVSIGDTPPSAQNGYLWFDSNSGLFSIYYQPNNAWLAISAGGPTGYTGSQGADNGFNGSIGFVGSAGFQGSTGYLGSVNIGYSGSEGFQGSEGYQGLTGHRGSEGYQGSEGHQGSVGFQGSEAYGGFQGSVGFIGSASFQGSVGFQGSEGFQGYQGEYGFQGSEGHQGSVGFQGTVGHQGSVAFQGSSGFQGCIGFTGPIPGTNTQIVFNDSGFANTSSGLFYQKDIQTLTIGNNLYVGGNIFVTGNVTTFAANNLQIVDNMFYLNSNSQFSNPDIGFAANYNDGTYHHTGFFRDHLDGRWKIFENYAPEPQASQYIDQSNNTFRLADFQSNALYTTYVFISNDLNINGNTVIGSDSSDVITFNALVNTAIVPAANNTYDLGTDNLRWKSLYISGNTIVLGTQSVSSNSSGMALSGTINANLAANSITINGDVVVGNTYLNDTFSTNSYNYSTYVSNTYLNTIPSIGYVSNVYFNDYTPVSNGYFNHYVPTSNSYINATYLTIDAFTSYNPVSNDYLTGVNTISLTNTNISSVLNVSNTVNSYYINAYSIFYNNFIQNIPVDKDFGDVSGSLDAFGVQLSSIIFDCNSQGSLTIFDAEI